MPLSSLGNRSSQPSFLLHWYSLSSPPPTVASTTLVQLPVSRGGPSYSRIHEASTETTVEGVYEGTVRETRTRGECDLAACVISAMLKKQPANPTCHPLDTHAHQHSYPLLSRCQLLPSFFLLPSSFLLAVLVARSIPCTCSNAMCSLTSCLTEHVPQVRPQCTLSLAKWSPCATLPRPLQHLRRKSS